MILENNVIFSKVIDHVLDEIDRGTPSPPNFPSGTFPQKYNLRSHVIDME